MSRRYADLPLHYGHVPPWLAERMTKLGGAIISILKSAVEKSKIGLTDKQKAIQQLSSMAWKIEDIYTPNPFFDDVLQKERDDSYLHGGMTVFGKAVPPKSRRSQQLDLF